MSGQEVDLLELLYSEASTRLGLAVGAAARDSYRTVNPTKPKGGDWQRQIYRLALAGRKLSVQLAISYYRYTSALQTGVSFKHPDGRDEATLKELRDEFTDMAQAILDMDFTSIDDSDEDVRWLDDTVNDLDRSSEDDEFPRTALEHSLADWLGAKHKDGSVRFKELGWPQDRIDSIEKAAQEFEKYLDEAGVTSLEDKVDRIIKRNQAAQKIKDLIDEEFRKHANRIAGIADKASLDAGRDIILQSARKDSRRKAYARGVRAGCCHFCAMLASRGFDFFNEQSAAFKAHPNCHCFPIVRWQTNELPERNAYYSDMWTDVTRGKSGRDARKAWRNWINAERRKSASANSKTTTPRRGNGRGRAGQDPGGRARGKRTAERSGERRTR
ncbi:VG15 protein [Brevibacterium moorei]|uniref:VG15 protein n=1 Tax=Brevibacterium moorei TaxID=2968457 RepID=UPI00211D0E80|nr:hypothetical protein [Brevibacterium sp. 68QC2CO]MCQ9385124.1 hypothetical protein [Brevibacterium sp. 68QC2CO]